MSKKTPTSMLLPATPDTVRVAPFSAIPDLLHKFGVKPAPLFDEFDITPGIFDDPDVKMPYSTAVDLLACCARRTGCQHFGLLVGQRAGLSSLGIVGYLVQHSPDVGVALLKLAKYLSINDRGATPALSINRDTATLSYVIYQNVGDAEQISHAAVAVGFNLMRVLCGNTWLPTEVLFAYPEPKDMEPFRRFFQAPVRFGAEQSALVFPTHLLSRPVSGSDPFLLRVLQECADRIRTESKDDIINDVRGSIQILLPTREVSLKAVADHLDIHARTLNRRLKDEGTSFREIFDELRYELACRLLSETLLSATQITLMVGYANASSFTRAFQQKAQLAPMAWRQKFGRHFQHKAALA